MSRLNELGKEKYFANRGVNRHKSPIANLVYKVEIIPFTEKNKDNPRYENFKFKDLGYLSLLWTKERAGIGGQYSWNWHGLISVTELKERIGEKQYAKFCQGKRIFIIQRRVNGKNVEINKK